ncbi:hypothetical protein V5O48_008100, partial [Marasmius crinis-equi]
MDLPHTYLRPSDGYSNMSAIDRHPAFEPQFGDTTAGANAIQNFSEGSPTLHYLDHEYDCVFESGEASTSASTSLPRHATGMTHPDNLARPFSDLYPEE